MFAVKQRLTKAVLQGLDLPTDRALSQTKLSGGFGKALVPRYGLERMKLRQNW